jgi:hypothetical protein
MGGKRDLACCTLMGFPGAERRIPGARIGTAAMSHRLQVLLDEEEIRALRAAAGRERVSVSEYVRKALRAATLDGPASGMAEILMVVREAAKHAYPVADPDQMEREIGAGYLQGMGPEGGS